MYGLIPHTESHNLPGLSVLIYFDKAVDSISWSFIYNVLNCFGFGENILS